MSKQPGYAVTTKTGKKGRTKHSDPIVNDKVIVYLEEGFKPILDENGNQKKLLCTATSLVINGYVD